MIQRMHLAELFAEEELNEDVYCFTNKYVEPKDIIAIVIDTNHYYEYGNA